MVVLFVRVTLPMMASSLLRVTLKLLRTVVKVKVASYLMLLQLLILLTRAPTGFTTLKAVALVNVKVVLNQIDPGLPAA
jgi:hypothetical protein